MKSTFLKDDKLLNLCKPRMAVPSTNHGMIHHFHSNIYIADHSFDPLNDPSNIDNSEFTFVDLPAELVPGKPSLKSIHDFAISIHESTISAPLTAVICCDNQSGSAIAVVGAYLLLIKNCDVADVLKAAENFRQRSSSTDEIFDDALFVALFHAKHHEWIGYELVDGRLICDNLEEHLHYAHPANGFLHIVIPNKLVIIPDAQSIPIEGQPWQDVRDESGRVVLRHFSPLYYAELLREMGAGVLTMLGAADPDVMAALEACGVALEDRLLQSDARSILRAHDRLHSLRLAGATVALQCGDGSADTGRVLVLAQLVANGMPGPAAEAWLSLTCPRLVAAPSETSLRSASCPADLVATA